MIVTTHQKRSAYGFIGCGKTFGLIPAGSYNLSGSYAILETGSEQMETIFSHRIWNGSFFSIRYGHTARHSLQTAAVILLVLLLTIFDAVVTLELVSLGAAEMNPIMCCYLNQGPPRIFRSKAYVNVRISIGGPRSQRCLRN